MRYQSVSKQHNQNISDLHKASTIFGQWVLQTLKNSFYSLSSNSEITDIMDEKQQNAFDRLEAKIDINESFKSLTDIEVDVVKLHSGINTNHPWSHKEISDYFGISPIKSQHIYNTAIKKLRKFFQEQEVQKR